MPGIDALNVKIQAAHRKLNPKTQFLTGVVHVGDNGISSHCPNHDRRLVPIDQDKYPPHPSSKTGILLIPKSKSMDEWISEHGIIEGVDAPDESQVPTPTIVPMMDAPVKHPCDNGKDTLVGGDSQELYISKSRGTVRLLLG